MELNYVERMMIEHDQKKRNEKLRQEKVNEAATFLNLTINEADEKLFNQVDHITKTVKKMNDEVAEIIEHENE